MQNLDQMVGYIEKYTDHRWFMLGTRQEFINKYIKEAKQNETLEQK